MGQSWGWWGNHGVDGVPMGLAGSPWGRYMVSGVAKWLAELSRGCYGVAGVPTGWQCPQVVGRVSTSLAGSPKGWKGPHRLGRVPKGSAESSQGRISSGSLSPSGSHRPDFRKSAENPPKICRIWSQMVNWLGAGLGV